MSLSAVVCSFIYSYTKKTNKNLQQQNIYHVIQIVQEWNQGSPWKSCSFFGQSDMPSLYSVLEAAQVNENIFSYEGIDANVCTLWFDIDRQTFTLFNLKSASYRFGSIINFSEFSDAARNVVSSILLQK